MANGVSQGAGKGPVTMIKSHLQSLSCYSLTACPLSQRFCLSLKGQEPIVSRILCLLFSCSPGDISRLIVAVIINAFKRMLWGRGATYISKKLSERRSPPWVYGNASPSVPGVALHTRIGTASNHGIPCAPFFRARATGSLSVNGFQLSRANTRQLTEKTATTLRGPIFQGESQDNSFRSTGALTPVTSVSSSGQFLGRSQNRPSRKLHPSMYFCFHTGILAEVLDNR